MKRIEISYKAKVNDYEKAEKALAREIKAKEKRIAEAKKYGVENWTHEDHEKWINSVEVVDGYIVNEKDRKKNAAINGILIWGVGKVEEAEERLVKAKKALDSMQEAIEAYRAEIEQIEDAKKKEALWEDDFEREQKEWAKDGITLESRYAGKTPNGEVFYIDRNMGYTDRSNHCFTLTIGKKTVFTSGEFWRCYMEIKRS